jgi:thioredoxin 1
LRRLEEECHLLKGVYPFNGRHESPAQAGESLRRNWLALGWHNQPMESTNISSGAAARFIVACLCAEWCSSCREYRTTFDQVAQEFANLQFVWVDVEDQAELVDGIDVENFPTVLVASDRGPLFYGPLPPQREVLFRLVQAQVAAESPVFLHNPKLSALLARLRELLIAK